MEIWETDEYSTWIRKLKDRQARNRILQRFDAWQAAGMVSGTVRNLKDGISEAKFDFGAGYRVYFAHKQNHIVLLVLGGDKSTQTKDIEKAKNLLRQLKENNQW